MPAFLKYNLRWPEAATPLQVELAMIKRGGRFEQDGKECGEGLEFHYIEAKRLLWNLDEHRWSVLAFSSMINNKSCVLMGCASSGKTHTAAVYALITYWAAPEETCILVSSTQMNSLKKRIWSEITMLWESAIEKHSYLKGHLLDSAVAITTDNIKDFSYNDRKARDMRKGIFGVACVQGGKFVGLTRFMGIKQKNLILIADEMGGMSESFVSAVANLNNNEKFAFVGMGNPNDLYDPLGKISEPVGGWSDEYLEPKKTVTWRTRFLNGICVNLVGYDSPNFDFPPELPTRYKYLISKEKIEETLTFFNDDSQEYYSMCKGVMKIGTMARRILSREMCIQFKALEEAIWENGQTTKVYFVDSAYGSDRCVAGWGEFGKEVSGKIVLRYDVPKIIPIRVGVGEPEAQIAEYVKKDCEAENIPPERMGHDSTGRGSLGTFLAREWSALTHPIEAGGSPTDRPITKDMKMLDEKTKLMRLKTGKDVYDRRVSEYNFQVRYTVESGQVRNLPEEGLEEFQARRWDRIANDKISVEPKTGSKGRPGFKERIGRSPDIADWCAGVLEMARRHGFEIEKMAKEEKPSLSKAGWLTRAALKAAQLQTSRQLKAA